MAWSFLDTMTAAHRNKFGESNQYNKVNVCTFRGKLREFPIGYIKFTIRFSVRALLIPTIDYTRYEPIFTS